MYMVRPANAQQSTKAFSSWISFVADNAASADLKQELDKMSDSGADIYKLMEHASLVMSKTDRDFDLPLESTDASNHILQVLLQQWSHFQTGNGMANVPPPEIVKTLTNISIDKYGSAFFTASGQDNSQNAITGFLSIASEGIYITESLEPMAGGIAIGAP